MISNMIFETEHFFWCWSSGEESNHYHEQNLLAEKNDKRY